MAKYLTERIQKHFRYLIGKKLEEIQLSPSPPEEMILPNGDFITAVKIISRVQRGGKKGDISFWLDTSYDNHPVRITFENKNKKLFFGLPYRNRKKFY
ncbi:MAG: hypothetical protein CM15mP58_07320 [Burkholderiaceae bacterium]|nr:MAG: hypothetical protein CM15mP58_07320 [Burkholderiaceae bacterium]